MSVASDRLPAPIHDLFKMAVWAGAETAVKLHIARGEDPNARDRSGLTLLMIAAARNKSTVCRLLIEAGADLGAVDRTGQDAFAIAWSAGAFDATAVIERALHEQRKRREVVDAHSKAIVLAVQERVPEPDAVLGIVAGLELPLSFSHVAGSLAPWASSRSADLTSAPDPLTHRSPVRLDFQDDGEPLNLSGWEASEDPMVPADDRAAAIAHATTQEAIARHRALDDSADWADFEAELPTYAAPLLRPQDADGRPEIRALLLRAGREGSVPEQAVEDVCRDANDARDLDTEALLRLTLNDMHVFITAARALGP